MNTELSRQVSTWKTARSRIDIAGLRYLKSVTPIVPDVPVDPPNFIEAYLEWIEFCQPKIEIENRRVATKKFLFEIASTVADGEGISQAELLSHRRSKKTAHARFLLFYLSKEMTDFSLNRIAKMLGDRHHTTVMYAIKCVEERMLIDVAFASKVETYRIILSGRMPWLGS